MNRCCFVVLVILLIAANRLWASEHEPGLLVARAPDSGLSLLCNAKVIGLFLSPLRPADYPPVPADKRSKEFCPTLGMSCCSIEQLESGLGHMKHGARQLKAHFKLLEKLIEALRRLGKDKLIGRANALPKRSLELVRDIDELFLGFDPLLKLAKALHTKLGVYFSGFLCELCSPASGTFYREQVFSSLLPPATVFSFATKNVPDLLAAQILNFRLQKLVQGLRRIMLAFSDQATLAGSARWVLAEPPNIDPGLRLAERCWERAEKNPLDPTDLCLDLLRGKNLLFIFEDYEAGMILKFAAKVLDNALEVDPNAFKEVDFKLMDQRVSFYNATQQLPGQWDADGIVADLQVEGFDMNEHKLNPKLWSNIKILSTLAVLITAAFSLL